MMTLMTPLYPTIPQLSNLFFSRVDCEPIQANATIYQGFENMDTIETWHLACALTNGLDIVELRGWDSQMNLMGRGRASG